MPHPVRPLVMVEILRDTTKGNPQECNSLACVCQFTFYLLGTPFPRHIGEMMLPDCIIRLILHQPIYQRVTAVSPFLRAVKRTAVSA